MTTRLPPGALSFGTILAVGLVPWLALALQVDVGASELGFGTALALLGVAGLIRKRGRASPPRSSPERGP